ncbi:hypothetical protein RND81_02G177700 [Saponaria officinalis]|uniref:Retrotransposon gag domain-containing protein n=1 Tax=Saponaria officinalis TaxID=3572 RepID=A0AAW1MXY4_SAPOF
MCKGFGSTLTGPALQWYINLHSGSITSFADLVNSFNQQFTSSRELEKRSSDLYRITQKPDESLRTYLNRFNKENVFIPRCDVGTSVEAFRQGLLGDSELYVDLTKYPCHTFEDVQAKALAHIRLEEDKSYKLGSLDYERPNRKSSSLNSSYRNSSRHAPYDKTAKSEVNFTQDRPGNSLDSPPIHEYNFSVNLPGLIRKLDRMGPTVRWPKKSNNPNAKKDTSKFYDFHNDVGHDTYDCIALRNEVAYLVKHGLLNDLIKNHDYRSPRTRKQQENQAPPPPIHEVKFISGGSEICGLTHSAAKRIAKEIKLKPPTPQEWLRNYTADSFDTWEKLSNAFLQKFFPPEKTAKLRNDITGFVQHEDESLYEAWERFKELQRQCHHHGIPSYLLVVTFYNVVKPELQMSLNAASGGRLDSMTWSRAKDLIEDMATQIDELTQQISQLKASSLSSSAQVCNLCGVQGHDSGDCISMPMSEQVNALGARTFDPYSNTYNPGWAHNPRLSYANNNNNNNTQKPPIQTQPKSFNQPPGLHPRPQPPPAQPKSSLELMMEQFVQVQGKKNDELTQSITNISNSVAGVTNSVSQLTSSQKMMETQIAQLAQQDSDTTKPQGQLPGKTEENPRGHVHAVTLRSGKEHVDPVVPSKSKAVSVTDEIVEIIDETADEPKKDAEEAAPKETVDITTTPQRVYVPPKYGKFVEFLKKLHINIPFLDAISEIPSYGKFLKDLLSRKKKFEDNTTVSLFKECSAILLKKLSQKLEDPGSFSILCSIGHVSINSTFCDLGASVSLMPLSIFRKLQMQELKPTRVSLQLADRSVKFPLGVCEDVPLLVGKLLIPCDFFVMDIPEDAHVPIILGRPCLAIAGAIIDVKNGKLSLQVGEDKVEFELNKSMRAPSMHDACYRVDVLKDYLTENSSEFSCTDKFKHHMSITYMQIC